MSFAFTSLINHTDTFLRTFVGAYAAAFAIVPIDSNTLFVVLINSNNIGWAIPLTGTAFAAPAKVNLGSFQSPTASFYGHK
jgi:hypothetical protein